MDQALLIPGFRIERVLGEGSSGTVYLALQESLGREVALKVLTGWLSDRSGRQRFQLEAQALAGMSHPNLLRLFEYQDDGAVPWLSVEYLPGGSLRDRIRTPSGGVPLPVSDALRLARNLLAALDALHTANLIHRDVKPANILYRDSGDAVLGDLGLVRQSTSERTRLTRAIDVVGTAAYMAPEVQPGRELTVATDLFAAGVTLYEAATGKHPRDYMPFTPGFRVTPPATLRPEIGPELSDLICALLEPEPIQRPATAKEALARLGAKRTPSRKNTKPTRPAESLPNRRRARWKPAVACAIALLAVAAYFGLAQAQTDWGLTVAASSTTARFRVPVAVSDLLLCVFDERGRVHACVNGDVGRAETRFEVEALEPGQSYRAQLFKRKGSGAPLSAVEAAFRTPIQLQLLGVDDGAPRGLWVSVSPPADARWSGGTSALRVGPEGKRLPIPAGASAERTLELSFAAGSSIQVRLRLGAAAAAAATLPLGVAVPKLAGQVRMGAAASPFVDWAVASRFSWAVVSPGADGAPNVARIETDQLWQRGRCGTLYLCAAPNAPADTPWVQKLGAFEPNEMALGVDPEWMGNVLDDESYQQTLRTLAGWRDFFRGRRPHVPFVVPTPIGLLMGIPHKTHKFLDFWGRTLPELQAIESFAVGAPAWHALFQSQILPPMKAAGFQPDVRWVWFLQARRETMGLDLPIERYSLARAFALSRAHFPQGTVIVDVTDLTDGPERQVRPATGDLLWIADALAGMTYDRELGTEKTAVPRLTALNDVLGMSFASEARRIQVLFPTHPTTVRFQPARPGLFKDQGGSVSRPILTTAPVDLTLSDGAAVFEELAPVKAEVQGDQAVDLR